MKKWLRRGALLSLGVLGLGLTAFVILGIRTHLRLTRPHHAHDFNRPLPSSQDSEAVLRGKHLAESRYGCSGCHGPDLGGGTMIDQGLIGVILGPNITRGQGSNSAQYTMADWDRIVRHGIKPDGTASFMPSVDFFNMSDDELHDIVAYARSVPPVARRVPAPKLGLLGTVLVATGRLPLSAERPSLDEHSPSPPETAETVQFGQHLASTCTGCHGKDLSGGPLSFGPPDWPPAANLTPDQTGTKDWTYDDFEKAMVSGLSKDGHFLRAPMKEVVAATRGMSKTERKALWQYLQSLPPVTSKKG